MAYIGRQNLGGAYRQLDDISSGFDGSDTTHTMQVNSQNVTVGDVNQIILSLGGVIQKPGTDFTVSGSVLTFTTAPAANTSFFAVLLGSDNGGTVTPTDGSVTGDKVASSGAFTIGAAGTASSLAGIPFFQGDTGSIYTHDVSGTDSTAQYNTAYGLTAMDAITTGDQNTSIGYGAGGANQTGAEQVNIGYQAGLVCTSSGNVLIGKDAGLSITSGEADIHIGVRAGDGYDTESHNLSIGVDALGGSVAGGEYNVAIGNFALDALTSGDYNIAIGYNAGTTMTSTTGNTLIGYEAGRAHNYDGAAYITMVGYQAGEDQTTSSYNTGFGAFNQRSSDTEQHNTSIGYYTMQGANGGGEFNTGLGSYVLGDASQSGDYNVGVGYRALYVATSGGTNCAVGVEAGYQLTSGSNNTLLGTEAGRSSSPATVTTGSDNIVIGNNSITNAYVKVDWTVTSDKRDKTDVKEFNMGLDFVNALNPVTYRWDMRSDYPNATPDGTHKKPKLFSGLIAQDVEILEREYGYKVEDDTAVITSVTEDGNYGLNYSKFVPVLINAVKELSAEIKTLKEEK